MTKSNKNIYYIASEDVTDYKVRMSTMRKKNRSFGSQNVDVNDYILSPAGWEGLMLSIYFLLIPYALGALFLFLFIARAIFEKFLLLDLASLFIVWAIGYEVLAFLLLTMIFFSYLKFLKTSIANN